MSRAGYTDEGDQWGLICWRGAVKSAMCGKRGQAFLVELRDALDALPDKRLIEHDLQRPDGSCCALGAVGKARGIDMTNIDPESWGRISKEFDIAEAMVREIEYENDECGYGWWSENVCNENGMPIYFRDRQNMRCPLYETNDKGVPVDKNGRTRVEYDATLDQARWSRMRQWVNSKIKSTVQTELKEKT